MRIEIKDKGTKEFYKYVVSVMIQYPQLIRKPQMKYRDAFKSYRTMGICMGVLFGMQLWLGFIDKFDALRVTAMAVVACAALVVFLYDRIMMKQVRRFLEDDKSSVVTLDEMGVEINKYLDDNSIDVIRIERV